MRVELLYKGIHPGPLFSSRDKTLRRFLAMQKTTESHGHMVHMAAATNNIDTMKDAYKQLSNSMWFEDLIDDRDSKMKEYYEQHVSKLNPVIYRADDGTATVKGLQ